MPYRTATKPAIVFSCLRVTMHTVHEQRCRQRPDVVRALLARACEKPSRTTIDRVIITVFDISQHRACPLRDHQGSETAEPRYELLHTFRLVVRKRLSYACIDPVTLSCCKRCHDVGAALLVCYGRDDKGSLFMLHVSEIHALLELTLPPHVRFTHSIPCTWLVPPRSMHCEFSLWQRVISASPRPRVS